MNIDELLSKLQSAGFIVRYSVEMEELGEMKLIQINNFSKHQRFTGSEADSESEFPAPSKEGNTLETFGNTLETPRTTGKEGKGKEGKGREGEAILPEIVFPFNSDSFKSLWELYKKFRWESHKFKYASSISEQAALMELSKISHADETTATKIINQTFAKNWKGLFPLKEENNGQSKSTGETRQTMAQRIAAEAIAKNHGHNFGR